MVQLLFILSLILGQSYAEVCTPKLIKEKLRDRIEEEAEEEYIDPVDLPNFDPNFFDKYMKRERLGPHRMDPMAPTPFGQLPKYRAPLKTIPVNPAAKMTDSELLYAGQFLRVNGRTQLAHLSDDTYIYLIDKYGRVLISSRTPDSSIEIIAEGTRYLASHRSLLNQFKILDPHVEIISAGEIKITHGVTTTLNNKSNTFRGDGAALQYAEKRLKEYGLPVQVNTQRVDYATRKLSDRHLNEAEEAQALIELRGDPRFKLIRDLFDELYEKFPATSQEPAGMPSKSEVDKVSLKIFDELVSRKNNGTVVESEESLYSDAVFMLSFLSSEGVILGAERFQKKNIEHVYNVVRIIQNAIQKDPIRVGRISTPMTPAKVPHVPVANESPDAMTYIHPRARAAASKTVNENEFVKHLESYSSNPEFAHHLARAMSNLPSTQDQVFRRAFIFGESNEQIQSEMKLRAAQVNSFKTSSLKRVKEYFNAKAPGFNKNLGMLIKGQDEVTFVEVEKKLAVLEGDAEFKGALKKELERMTGEQLKIFNSILKKESDEQIAASIGMRDRAKLKKDRLQILKNLRIHFEKDYPANPEFIDEAESLFGVGKVERVQKRPAVEPESVNAAPVKRDNPVAASNDLQIVTHIQNAQSMRFVDARLKNELAQEISKLAVRQKNIFVRTLVNHENDEQVALALGTTVRTVRSGRNSAIQTLRQRITETHPDLAENFDSYIVNQFRNSGRRLKGGPATGEIPDAGQVLSAPQFNEMDPKFKDALAQEIMGLSPVQQQAFVRMILKGENAKDLELELGLGKGEMQVRRSSAIQSLKNHFKKNHPAQFEQLESFLQDHKQRR